MKTGLVFDEQQQWGKKRWSEIKCKHGLSLRGQCEENVGLHSNETSLMSNSNENRTRLPKRDLYIRHEEMWFCDRFSQMMQPTAGFWQQNGIFIFNDDNKILTRASDTFYNNLWVIKMPSFWTHTEIITKINIKQVFQPPQGPSCPPPPPHKTWWHI